MGISWPVNGVAAVSFVAWVPLLLIHTFIRRNPTIFSRGATVLYSYVSFLIFNLFVTWWVAYSTTVGAALAFILNTLFMALTFGLAHLVDRKVFKEKAGFFALVFFWVAYEYLHQNWDLTWSWLVQGNVFSENPNWVQWYEYTGPLGGSIWVIAVNILIAKAILRYIDYGKPQYSIVHSVLALLLIFVPIFFSFHLKNNVVEGENKVNVLLIQPNIEPYDEAYTTPSNELMHNVLDITRKNMDSQTQIVITPESSIERTMWESRITAYPAIDSLRVFFELHPKLSFLMGASTRRLLAENEYGKACARPLSDGGFYCNYNTALFAQKRKQIEFYHKKILVPGVEKMPYTALLKPLEKYAINLGGTFGTLGCSTEPKLFKINENAYVAPIICYESIYGELVGSFIDEKPSFIAVITNDAWWYDSPGHKQLFSYARLRAIETRNYVVRAANTGFSGVINAKGEILQKTKFYEKTAVKASIPLSIVQTYYSQVGDYLGRLSVFLVGLLVLVFVSKSLTGRKRY